MEINASTLSLNVDDVAASSRFVSRNFGYVETYAVDGFASLAREGCVSIIFLRRGIEQLPEGFRDETVQGLIIAFTVADVTVELRRFEDAGVDITLPLREEPWGERLFQVKDPNGIIYQLVDWTKVEAQAGSQEARP